MKVKIIDKSNKEIGQREMPSQFSEEIRPDLIHRAAVTIQKNKRHPYGASPESGKRHSAKLSRRRRDYKGSYGHGISRVPRKIMSRRGTRMNWVGAISPGTVGGREAHPPKSGKILTRKLNKKERKKAIRSALSATLSKDIVSKRGHKVPGNYPFIIGTTCENIGKVKELKKMLIDLGFSDELKRASTKSIRSGRGKSRGRKYKKRIGPLFVVSNECKLMRLKNSIPGFNIIRVNDLNVEVLAPGTYPGRLTVFTENAIDRLEKGNMFI